MNDTIESKSEAPAGPVIPDFRDDERARARYESMLERRKKEFARQHEASIRRLAAEKRREMKDQLDALQEQWELRKEAADAARAAYKAVCPTHVTRLTLKPPSLVENLRTRGEAARLHRAAEDTWQALQETASEIRRLEHNEGRLDLELQKALERAPKESQEVVESEKWLAEVHAEETMATAKARIDAIDAERAAYAERLAAGRVPPDELRLRSFADQGIEHVEATLDGVLFERVVAFGERAWFVLRDLRGRAFALPYDRRLEPLLENVYDVARAGERSVVRRHLRDGRNPLTVRDFFARNAADDDALAAALERHRAFVAERRTYADNAGDDVESALQDAFAEFGRPKAA